MAAAPLAVVGAQFCVAHALPLTLAMHLTRGCTVTDDASGTVVLRMHAPLLRTRRRFLLLDAAGRPLLTVQRKLLIYSRWQVFRGDSLDAGDLLFTARRSPLLQLTATTIDVLLASNEARQGCDFRMKASFNERSCVFCLGGSDIKIAEMRRQVSAPGVLLGKGRISVTVFPNVDYAFIVAPVLMLQEIHMQKRQT